MNQGKKTQSSYQAGFWSQFFQSAPKKEQTFMETIINDFSDTVSEAGYKAIPDIERSMKEMLTDLKHQLKSEFEKQVTPENVQEVMKIVYDQSMKVCCGNKKASEVLNNIIAAHRIKVDIATNPKFNVKDYEEKLRLAQTYLKSILGHDKKAIKIVALGETQQGKTSTIKYLFQLSDDELKVKKGLESDTIRITEYIIEKYGITLIFVDFPGFHDTRGPRQEKKNKESIEDYFRDNKDIDIILLVSRIGCVLDSKQKGAIEELTKKYSSKMWEKCIVILTYANSESIPSTYYPKTEEDSDYEYEEGEEIEIWESYVYDKIKVWKDYFKKVAPNMSICPVENSKRHTQKVEGVRVLKNGIPFWEDLMYEIFRMVDGCKAPLALLAVADEQEETRPSAGEHRAEVNNAANRVMQDISAQVAMPHTSASTPSSTPTPTKSSWCFII